MNSSRCESLWKNLRAPGFKELDEGETCTARDSGGMRGHRITFQPRLPSTTRVLVIVLCQPGCSVLIPLDARCSAGIYFAKTKKYTPEDSTELSDQNKGDARRNPTSISKMKIWSLGNQ